MGTVTGLFKGIKAEFQQLTLAPERLPYAPFVQEVDSVSNQEDYWIPSVVGNVRNLLDGVQLQELYDYKMTIVNKGFYDGLRENRMNILNSQEYLSANVVNKINSVVNAWQTFKVNNIDSLIANGGSTSVGLAFDGTPFFSSSGRPNISSALMGGSTGGSNKSTGAGTDTSSIWSDYGTVRNNFYSIRDVNKRYFNDPNNSELYIMCPVNMIDSMQKIFNPGQTLISIAGVMQSNPYAGTAKIIALGTTSTGDWYLANAKSAVKPFIVQNRLAPEWFMTDDNKYEWVDYYYKAYCGFGYGSPFSVYWVHN